MIEYRKWSNHPVKVTTEKMPNSMLALNIEIDQAQVEKALDRAAQRISQKHTIPGFRKGKAPRFIIEKYFGFNVLLEEASEDLIKRSYKDALKQENIVPIGPANIEPTSIDIEDGFRFRVTVPISPTVTLPDYHAIHIPLDISPVTEETIQRSLEMVRERHVMLKELEDLRPAREGDALTVIVETLIDGKRYKPADGEELTEEIIPLVRERLKSPIFEGLLDIIEGETRTITYTVADEDAEEDMRGREVTFNVHVLAIQERVLPDWDELPELETFDGTLDAYKDQIRFEIEKKVRTEAEKKVFDTFVQTLISESTFDISEATIIQATENAYQQHIEYMTQYGMTEEQFLTHHSTTREEAMKLLVPAAIENLRQSMVLLELSQQEHIVVTDEEVAQAIEDIINQYSGEEQARLREDIPKQYREQIINHLFEQKLWDHIIVLATKESPAHSELPRVPVLEADETQPANHE